MFANGNVDFVFLCFAFPFAPGPRWVLGRVKSRSKARGPWKVSEFFPSFSNSRVTFSASHDQL